tara:strand:+ start:847 stop:1071 length:225 start_codon:yes stop_codon:yes gene_type:complete
MTNTNFVGMKLSNHAVGTLMMCLQKCLLEQSDITGILGDLVFLEKDGELFCKNPPLFKVTNQPAVQDDYEEDEF